jgi:tetratricopeptide (TPR) repeat protein
MSIRRTAARAAAAAIAAWMAAASGAAAQEFDLADTAAFCTTCHSMELAAEPYRQSSHYQPASGVRASCGDCHVSEGVIAATWDHFIGGKDLIRYRDRQLTINPGCCWVDSLALRQLLEKGRGVAAPQAVFIYEKAVGLHKGPFLTADTDLAWIVASRETLKNGLLRITMTAGRHYEQAGAWERAVEFYDKGIETDPLAEEFYRRLMLCQRQLGNHADVVTIYQRCCCLLRAELDIAPSPETTAVYTSIMLKQ